MISLKRFGYGLLNIIFLLMFLIVAPVFVLVSLVIEIPNGVLEGFRGNPIYSHRYVNLLTKFKNKPKNLKEKFESSTIPTI